MTDRLAVLVITDGRRNCMQRTMESWSRSWDGPVADVTIIDDSADATYAEWLEANYGRRAHIVHNPIRLGFGGAIQEGWDALRESGAEWIFHLEDDFLFQRPVPVRAMLEVLGAHPYLAQMSLRRQPWGPEEVAAGGYIAMHRDAYEERDVDGTRWLEHRLFFTTNPSVYSGDLTELGWPDGDESEGVFAHRVLGQGFADVKPGAVRFGVWGPLEDEPWVTHIGDQRVGTGY